MILTTTGTAATVTLTGLLDINNNDLVLTHPVTVNLLDDYDEENIRSVEAVIQAALDAGELTATTQNGEPITDASQAASYVSAAGSVGVHEDVDLTGIATNDQLSWDGSQFVPVSTPNGFTIFPIWAEENAAIANGQREWSFGNGAVGAINIVIPVDCEMFAVSFDAETGSGTVTMDIMQNDAVAYTTGAFAGLKDFETLGSPVAFTAGDCLGFQTNTVSATITDARVCAWMRIRSAPASTSVLNDLLDVSAGAPSTGNVLGWNGANWAPTAVGSGAQAISNDFASFAGTTISGAGFTTLVSTSITLASAGWIHAIGTMTGVRSTGTNAIGQLRVQINGDNGTTILDTFSTFNDSTSAQHRLAVAAGTYTINLEAVGDAGITVSGNLYATGVES